MYCKHSFHDSIDNKTTTGDAKREGKLETTQYPAPFDIFCLCFLRGLIIAITAVRIPSLIKCDWFTFQSWCSSCETNTICLNYLQNIIYDCHRTKAEQHKHLFCEVADLVVLDRTVLLHNNKKTWD